jgi:hypothetical protein
LPNVPSDPYAEEAWERIVGTPQSLRSIFQPTEVFSIFVYAGRDIVAIPIENRPYGLSSLRDFVVPAIGKDVKFTLFLQLSGRLSLSSEVHVVSFPMRWNSRHTRSNGDVVFIYRKGKVIVRVPVTPQDATVDRLPNATSDGKQTSVPIERVILSPASVLGPIISPKSLRKRKEYPTSPKNGFDGVPSRPYPEIVEIPIFDAHFPAVGPAYLDGERSLLTFFRDKASVSTPNFRTLSKGKLPVNPFVFTQVRIDDMPSMDRLTFPPSSGLVKTDFFGATAYTFFTPPALPGHNSAVRNKAISNVIKKAEEDISANMAQNFAQFGQLTSLIGGNATKLAKSFQAVKSGNVVQALNILGTDHSLKGKGLVKKRVKHSKASDTAADTWLQIQMAWKPLLSDIDAAMKLLADSILKKPAVVTVRSSSHKEEKVTQRTVFFPGKEDIIVEIHNYYSCRVGVRYTHRSQLVNYLQQTGFTNPINLVWEILPYSFVYDYFHPIGPYLETLSAWQSKFFCGGFITEFTRGEVSCGFDLSNESGGYVRNVKGGYKRSSVQVNRSPLGDFPRLDLPKPKNPVSITHAINAIALLQRAFTR